MKRLFLFVIFVLTTILTKAQVPTNDSTKYIWYQNQYGLGQLRIAANEYFGAPYKDTTGRRPFRPGFINTHIGDGKLYLWNGVNWVSISGGSGADSSVFETRHRTDTAKVNIRNEFTPKNLYGLIYAKGSWVNLNDFDNNGADPSISGGKILLQPAGSPATFTQSLDLKGVTNLEYWRVLVQYTLKTSPSSTTYGLGVGVRSINTHVTSSVLGYTDLTTDGTNGGRVFHAVDYPTPAVLASSSGTLSRSLDDQFETVVEREGANIKVTTRNLTTNSVIQQTTYDYSTTSGSRLIHNTGKFSFFAIGGQVRIDSIAVFSKEIKGADLLCAGDSKTVGYFSQYYTSWINLIRPSFHGVVLSAGGGDRPQEIYARLNEILALQPRQVLLEIGTNESDSSVTKDYIQRINDTLVAHGIRVIHTAFYQSSFDVGWRYNFLLRTFPFVINSYTRLTQPNTLDGDGVHPNAYGNVVIAADISQSGKILFGQYFTPRFGGSSGGINNQTTVQTGANFYIDGTGIAGKFSLNPASTGNAVVELFNLSASSTDAPLIIRPGGTGGKSSEIYIVPLGGGSGGNITAFNLFNSDYVADQTNFGFLAAQMKATEFSFHTDYSGSGTLVPIHIFTGSNTQLKINTDGTNGFTGNTFFNNKVVVGPSFTTPFSKSLIHASNSVNNAVYNMISNANTGVGASAGFKANLDPTREDTNYFAMQIVGANYSDASRPTIGGGSAILETTAPGDMYHSAHNDTGDIVFTTDTSMIERMRIAHIGAITFGKGSNSYTFPTTRAAAGQVLTDASGTGSVTWSTLILKGSTTWQPGIVGANSSATTTLTVTGAATTDVVHVNKVTGGLSNGEIYDAYVSATNTVTIRVHNVSGGSANYNTTETYNVIVMKY